MFILFGQSGLINRKKEIGCHQCFQPPSLRLTLLMGTWQAFSRTVPHFKGYHLNMEFFIPIPVFKQGYAWVWKVTWEVNFILMIPRKITRWKNLRKIVGLRYDVLRPGVSPAWCSIDINIINFTDIKYMELDTCSVVSSFMAVQLCLQQRCSGIQPVKWSGQSAAFF